MAKLSITGFVDHSLVPYAPVGEVKETFEFLTDVTITHDGSEDRVRNREIARHSFSYQIPASLFKRQEVFNNTEQNLRGYWAFPIWVEGQPVGTVSGTTISCDTSFADLRVDGLVLIFSSNDVWQVRQIDAVDKAAGTITLASSASAQDNAYLIPIHRALMRGPVRALTNGYEDVFEFNFNKLEPVAYPTKNLALHITVDWAFTVESEGLTTNFRSQVTAMLETVRGLINAGIGVDLEVCYLDDFDDPHTFLSATSADIDTAIATLSTTPSGGYNPSQATQRINDFFGTVTPNPDDGTRKDIAIWLTKHDGTSLTTAVTNMADIIARTAPFDGFSEVDVHGCLLFHNTTYIQIVKIDNVQDDTGNGISYTDADHPFAAYDQFREALRETFGNWFEGLEVLPEALSSNGSMEKSITKREDRIDFGGVFSVRSPWLQSRVQMNYQFGMEDQAEAAEFRRSIYRRAGAANTFYLPSQQYDLRMTGISTDRLTLTIEADGFDAYTEDRRRIGVRERGGLWEVYNVDTVTPIGVTEFELVLDRPMLVDDNAITQVSYVGIGRFDTDRIEVVWIGGYQSEAAVMVVEIEK